MMRSGFASYWGGETELVVAKDFDPSPNSAIAYLKRPDGRILLIDFLHGIVGVSNQEICKTAVRVTVAGCELQVLHPLLCLKSRLANLESLSTKRNTNGIMQAQWAINIVHAYLLNLLDREGVAQRDLIRGSETFPSSQSMGLGRIATEISAWIL